MAMGTRNIYNEDHDMFRQSVRTFFNEEVIPHHDQWEEDGQVSRELWQKAGETGLLGVSLSMQRDGRNRDTT